MIKLRQYVDSEWLSGEFDGKKGIFPISYVQIIVDLPPEKRTAEKVTAIYGYVELLVYSDHYK
jgi:hypothetical protein